MSAFSFLRPRRRSRYLFLASHGLRSQLSALRWASGRLLRTQTAGLSREQRHLLDEVHSHTKLLTASLGSMFLLDRLEEGEEKKRTEEKKLIDLLQATAKETDDRTVEWTIDCPSDIRITADPTLVQHLFLDLLLLCREAAAKPRRVVVTAREDGTKVSLQYDAIWELPLLGSGTHQGQSDTPAIGGTPGLMLALASDLAQAMGGSVELREIATEEEDLVLDGTVERSSSVQNEFRIVVVLPKR